MPIAFNCPKCGKGYQVPDAVAGRSTKCRQCGTTMTIPLGSAAIAPMPLAPPPPPPMGEIPTLERAEPAAAGGKWPMKRVGLIAAAVLVALVGAVSLYGISRFVFGGTDSMKYLPDNCQGIVCFRLADFVNSKVYADLKKEFPEIDIDKLIEQQGDQLQLKSGDYEEIMIGFGDFTKQEFVGIIKTKKAIGEEEFTKPKGGKTYTKSTVAGHTVYEDFEAAYCVVNKNLAVVGEKKTVKAVLERNKKPEIPEGLEKALKETDLSATLSFAMSFSQFSRNRDVVDALREAKMEASAEMVEAIAGQVQVRSDISASLVMLCKDSKSADSVRKMAEGGVEIFKNAAKGEIPPEVTEILDSIKVAASGSRVTGNLSFKVAPLVKLIKDSMQPRAAPFQKVGGPIEVPVPP
jgi:hypothetical protein